GSPVPRPRGDGGGSRLVDRGVSFVRLRPRRLRCALRGKARAAAEGPGRGARALERPIPAGTDGTGSLSATAAATAADLGRRGRDTAVICPRRGTRTSADGRDHRRRDTPVPAPGGSVSRGWQARRSSVRTAEGGDALAR